MIIDMILDRRAGYRYNAKEFYDNVVEYNETFDGIGENILQAMNFDDEHFTKIAIRWYLKFEGYYEGQNMETLGDYVDSVEWLKDDEVEVTK
jgi:hypothetical protein